MKPPEPFRKIPWDVAQCPFGAQQEVNWSQLRDRRLKPKLETGEGNWQPTPWFRAAFGTAVAPSTPAPKKQTSKQTNKQTNKETNPPKNNVPGTTSPRTTPMQRPCPPAHQYIPRYGFRAPYISPQNITPHQGTLTFNGPKR